MKRNIDLTLNRDFEISPKKDFSFDEILSRNNRTSTSFSDFDLSDFFDDFFETTESHSNNNIIPKVSLNISLSEDEQITKFPVGSFNEIKEKNKIIQRNLLFDNRHSCDRCGSDIPFFYFSTLCKKCDEIVSSELNPLSAYNVFYK